ncbi:MAG: hypothetical protein LBS30_01885 [Planctomycetota bacterium]|jgi:truncated hemoglobin YjbI|nr:hypothetical protein [Planctomycetota bacterium]
MPSVTLTAPVTHDDEKLEAGDVIRDLTDRAAKRLVALGVATMGESVTVDDDLDDDDKAPPDLPQGDVSLIRRMKKPEVMAALAKAGIAASESEKLAELKEKLTAAWSAPSDDDDDDGTLSPEEQAEITGMNREELIEALEAVNVAVSEADSDDELRAKLKHAYSEDAAGA